MDGIEGDAWSVRFRRGRWGRCVYDGITGRRQSGDGYRWRDGDGIGFGTGGLGESEGEAPEQKKPSGIHERGG